MNRTESALLSIALVSLLACMGQPVRAQEDQKIIMMYGMGTLSCGTYLKGRKNDNPADIGAMKQWIAGYMSGRNALRKLVDVGVVALPGFDDLLPFLDKYCRDNPLDKIVDGANALETELIQRMEEK